MQFLAGSELPVYSRLPISLLKGEGCKVWDQDGKEYIDFYGGHAVASLGYAHPAWTCAVIEQIATLQFQTNAVGLEIRTCAIQKLVDVAPNGLRNAFLVNTGAEATENALRLAFWKSSRPRVACLTGAFHGRTAAAGAVTDHSEKWYGFPHAPFPIDRIQVDSLDELDQKLSDQVAAFIFEPVQGVGGAIDLDEDFLLCAAEICKQRGIVLIADEVQTGIGRTGTMFCVEQYGVNPDILITAKGLGNGFPVAAVLCTDEIAAQAGTGMLGTTFGGGPVASAAICAVLDEVQSPGFLERVQVLSKLLRLVCGKVGVATITGRGLLLGLHLERPAAPVRKDLLDRGYITGDAKLPNVIRLLPPLVISEQQILAFGETLAEVLR